MRKNNSPKKGRFFKKSKKLKKTRILIEKLGVRKVLGLFDPKGSAPHRKMGSEPLGAEKVTFLGSQFPI